MIMQMATRQLNKAVVAMAVGTPVQRNRTCFLDDQRQIDISHNPDDPDCEKRYQADIEAWLRANNNIFANPPLV